MHVHGGPTSNSFPVLSMEKAFFTSRGIGVIDVNYGGSSGYGRQDRDRLRGLGHRRRRRRLRRRPRPRGIGRGRPGPAWIRGGSAGGWTALAAITSGPALTGTKEAVFAAVTAYY